MKEEFTKNQRNCLLEVALFGIYHWSPATCKKLESSGHLRQVEKGAWALTDYGKSVARDLGFTGTFKEVY